MKAQCTFLEDVESAYVCSLLKDYSVFESMIDMILCAIAEPKGRQSAQMR